MKFDCGETWEEKHKRLSNWHDTFAWTPKRVGNHDCRWLETVERKGTYFCCLGEGFWEWKYRAKES